MKIDGGAVARRVYVIMLALAGGGIVGAWMLWGPAGAWGFAFGCLISFGNAWWTHRLVMSVGPGGKKAGAPLIAIFRYLLMFALLYVILSYSEIGFLAALAGCFTHITAVV